MSHQLWPGRGKRGAGTIPTRTIPTATIPTSVIIVGLLSAYWRSPAPRSTCGTGRVRVRVRVSDTGACRNGECRNGACRNSACRNGDLYPLTLTPQTQPLNPLTQSLNLLIPYH